MKRFLRALVFVYICLKGVFSPSGEERTWSRFYLACATTLGIPFLFVYGMLWLLMK